MSDISSIPAIIDKSGNISIPSGAPGNEAPEPAKVGDLAGRLPSSDTQAAVVVPSNAQIVQQGAGAAPTPFINAPAASQPVNPASQPASLNLPIAPQNSVAVLPDSSVQKQEEDDDASSSASESSDIPEDLDAYLAPYEENIAASENQDQRIERLTDLVLALKKIVISKN